MEVPCLLYDTNARRRELTSAALDARGIRHESYYSLDGLTLRLRGEDPIILITPDRSVGTLLREGVEAVWIPEKLPEDPTLAFGSLVSQVAQAKVAAVNRETSRSTRLSRHLIVIGSSTGGFPVAQEILTQIRIESGAVVLCQHISAEMTGSLADALSARMQVCCEVVRENTEVRASTVYLLQGGSDFEFKEKYGRLYLQKSEDKASPYHPSLNLLSGSMVGLKTWNRTLFVLSGLGADGSQYLARLRAEGAEILAQDPKSAVAPGMPLAALAGGARIISIEAARERLRRLAG